MEAVVLGMTVRIILFLAASLPVIYDAVTLRIIDRKRQEPLPEEVSDVYSPERWNTFVRYKHDARIPYLIRRGWAFFLDAFVIFSPFYAWIESASGANVYLAVLLTGIIMTLIPLIVDLPVSLYQVFQIEQRYGLNHRTPKEFWKDFIIELLGGFVLNILLYELLTFILLHLRTWTGDFSLSAGYSVLLSSAIAAVLLAFIYGASWISWRLMRMRYRFVPLEDGELKDAIMKLLKGSRRNVSRIEVYNESAKSNSKNAFVLKLPFYRSIGIADNFLSENARDELLGVLAHEAGHLKHKPNILNWLSWVIYALLFFCLVSAVKNGEVIALAERMLENVFHLQRMNTMLSVNAVIWLFQPVFFLLSVLRKYVSRSEEYEADRNAVAEGYGEPLIRTFKEISSDELVDVNPSDLIEFLEYDHPGMYHRIRAIHQAMHGAAS